MDREVAGRYTFAIVLAPGEREQFNVSYRLAGQTLWAITSSGIAAELRSISCSPDEGSALAYQLVPNGLSGSQASQNIAITAP